MALFSGCPRAEPIVRRDPWVVGDLAVVTCTFSCMCDTSVIRYSHWPQNHSNALILSLARSLKGELSNLCEKFWASFPDCGSVSGEAVSVNRRMKQSTCCHHKHISGDQFFVIMRWVPLTWIFLVFIQLNGGKGPEDSFLRFLGSPNSHCLS